MNIYLVRHGESQSNYDNKHGKPYFCGQLDVPLTEKGMQSAQDLVTYFTTVRRLVRPTVPPAGKCTACRAGGGRGSFPAGSFCGRGSDGCRPARSGDRA